MKDPKYDSLSHAKFRIQYHIIFSTKYRRNVLSGSFSEEIKQYMKQFYWKKPHHLWTRGYFCSTIGDACTSTIWNYIQHQG